MNNLFDIHTLAESYLRDLEGGKTNFYQEEETPVLPLVDCGMRVVVVREEMPSYLAGIKPSGRPVFTHDMKLAASYDASSWKLDEVLERLKIYDLQVDTMPACWYSNHQ
jgi:hypothetical protein